MYYKTKEIIVFLLLILCFIGVGIFVGHLFIEYVIAPFFKFIFTLIGIPFIYG